MNLEAIQQTLKGAGVDGWLFYDFHHRDHMAYTILGLDINEMTTRRWFYWIPAEGEPVKLSHTVEPRRLDPLPGRQEFYLPWTQLREKLGAILAGTQQVAMQYSPMADVPIVSVVDAGTIELVRSLGPDVVSSADLVQQFEATLDADGLASHAWAGERVIEIKDEAYGKLDEALRSGKPVDEYEITQFIVSRFEDEGMTCDGEPPIVGFNDHPANPHYHATKDGAYTLKQGDTILIDLWARRHNPVGIFYDVTWCGFAGQDPPAEYVKIFETVRDARDAALDLIRERFEKGEPCNGNEVDIACRKVVEDAGYGERFLHRTGHSIGTTVHGNGGNMDDLETRDTRKLIPGACFSIEPGIYLEGKMAARSEINVTITLDGKVEVCGPMQQELILLGA